MTIDEQRGNPVRVLLVEDHPALALALTELLQMDERLVVVACVGTLQDALRAETIGMTDVVLSDVHLEDGTGVELLRAIRAARSDLPVILMSGSGDDETAREARAVGAYTYLEKGRILEEVIDLILEAADTSSPAAH
jgi:DNA-binding NtrC family response regulator